MQRTNERTAGRRTNHRPMHLPRHRKATRTSLSKHNGTGAHDVRRHAAHEIYGTRTEAPKLFQVPGTRYLVVYILYTPAYYLHSSGGCGINETLH